MHHNKMIVWIDFTNIVGHSFRIIHRLCIWHPAHRAMLFFRPEACRINGNEGNCIEGKVDRWEYLGDSITITLNASGVPITIKQNKSVRLTRGQEMRICVGADDCFLLLDL